MQCLRRAFLYNQDPSFPETFQVFISKTPTSPQFALGLIRELNMSCKVIVNDVTEAAGGLAMTDWWLVKVKAIPLNSENLIVEPVELIERLGASF